tara:strand:- start:284 stop:520 length:237 start_codon:yes stop_codon:yes gene_type:complete
MQKQKTERVNSLIEQAEAARIERAEHLIKNLVDSNLDLTTISNRSKSYFLTLVGEKRRISFKSIRRVFRKSMTMDTGN